MSQATMTVAEATQIREQASEAEKHVYDLIDCCLNAEAALTMLGAKRVKPRRRHHFRPAGAMVLDQIDQVLATSPVMTALVKASLAFGCDYCGKPAETGTDDGWICEACIQAAQVAS